MRSTSLGTALALLILGCGMDRDATGPEDPGLSLPDPVGVPESEFASATAPTNVWAPKAARADLPVLLRSRSPAW